MRTGQYASVRPPHPPRPLRAQIETSLAGRARVSAASSVLFTLFVLATTSALTSCPKLSLGLMAWRVVLALWHLQLARTVGRESGSPRRWIRRFGFVTVVAGLTWGLMASACLVMKGLGAEMVMVLVVIAGVLSAAVNVYASVPTVMRAHSASVLIPIVATALVHHLDRFSLGIATTLLFYLVFLWIQGAQAHREVLGALKNAYRLERRAVDLHRSREDLRRLALYDPLTAALNRGEGQRALERELRRARRERTLLAVVLLDLDHFKRINDTFGHSGGDAVLCAVVRRFQTTLRAYDLVIRYGGEEFLVLLPGCDLEKGRRVAERLRLAVAEAPVASGKHAIPVTASFGVAAADDHIERDSLVEAADRALYRAKRSGRNRVELTTAPPG